MMACGVLFRGCDVSGIAEEEAMLNTRLGKVVYLLFAVGLVLTALLLVRAKRAQATQLDPGQDLRDGGRVYQQRISETERLLDSTTPFELSERSGGGSIRR